MKRIAFAKAIVLSCFMAAAMALPMTSYAQRNDDFFKVEDDDWTRSVGISIGTGSIINQGVGEPAPLGSGLAILTLAGAGYAAFKRKRKTGATFILMLVMMLGFTQCKKNLETINSVTSNKVHITLNVGDDKANVNPTGGGTYATVEYETGDIIYVGYNKHYVGYMTYGSGGFSGDVDLPTSTTDPAYIPDTQLQFYYLGGIGYTPDMTNASDDIIKVDISDQCGVDASSSVHRYPIISYAKSMECYNPENLTQEYSAKLLNKCAMVKFNVNKPDGYNQAGTCIMGLNNLVTVNFNYDADNTDEGFSYSQVNDGAITISPKIGEVWAVLLPQDAISAGGDMSLFSGRRKGTRPAMDAIEANDYKPTGITLTVTTEYVPTGVKGGLFTVNSNGKQVYFSKGNLQYIGSATTPYWKFADNQYDYFGTSTGQNSTAENVDRDLFGWCTSGYNHNNGNYHPYCTEEGGDYRAYTGTANQHMYEKTGKADWGYNPIYNKANKQWRTFTNEELIYILDSRTFEDDGKQHHRWAKAKVMDFLGIILFPDNYDADKYGNLTVFDQGFNYTSSSYKNVNLIDSDGWTTMENEGAIFLPCAGIRGGTNVADAGSACWYWTSSAYTGDGTRAMRIWVSYASTSYGTGQAKGIIKNKGLAVRLVCE